MNENNYDNLPAPLRAEKIAEDLAIKEKIEKEKKFQEDLKIKYLLTIYMNRGSYVEIIINETYRSYILCSMHEYIEGLKGGRKLIRINDCELKKSNYINLDNVSHFDVVYINE